MELTQAMIDSVVANAQERMKSLGKIRAPYHGPMIDPESRYAIVRIEDCLERRFFLIDPCPPNHGYGRSLEPGTEVCVMQPCSEAYIHTARWEHGITVDLIAVQLRDITHHHVK